MSKTHSVKTIGPVRLELLPDGRYLLHIEQQPEIDVAALAQRVVKEIRRQGRDCAEKPPLD